jgi:hypothetical protein
MMLQLSADLVAVRARLDADAYRSYEAGIVRIPAAALFEVCRVLSVPVRFVFDRYPVSEGAAKEWARHPLVPRL